MRVFGLGVTRLFPSRVVLGLACEGCGGVECWAVVWGVALRATSSAALLKLFALILHEAVLVFGLSPSVLSWYPWNPLGLWLLDFRCPFVHCSCLSFCKWPRLVAILFQICWCSWVAVFGPLGRVVPGLGFLLVTVGPWCQLLSQCVFWLAHCLLCTSVGFT